MARPAVAYPRQTPIVDPTPSTGAPAYPSRAFASFLDDLAARFAEVERNAPKVRVSFLGSNGAIQGTAQNVTSVVRSATGTYAVTFTQAFADANFVPVAMPRNASGFFVTRINAKTTSTTTISVYDSTGTAADPSGVEFVAFGELA